MMMKLVHRNIWLRFISSQSISVGGLHIHQAKPVFQPIVPVMAFTSFDGSYLFAILWQGDNSCEINFSQILTASYFHDTGNDDLRNHNFKLRFMYVTPKASSDNCLGAKGLPFCCFNFTIQDIFHMMIGYIKICRCEFLSDQRSDISTNCFGRSNGCWIFTTQEIFYDDYTISDNDVCISIVISKQISVWTSWLLVLPFYDSGNISMVIQ